MPRLKKIILPKIHLDRKKVEEAEKQFQLMWSAMSEEEKREFLRHVLRRKVWKL